MELVKASCAVLDGKIQCAQLAFVLYALSAEPVHSNARQDRREISILAGG